jgi:hypothetical protein
MWQKLFKRGMYFHQSIGTKSKNNLHKFKITSKNS